jgi:hypothetical protein
MLMYERRIEHSLYRTLAELKRHRILAEIGPGQMWELKTGFGLRRREDGESRAGRPAYGTARRRRCQRKGGSFARQLFPSHFNPQTARFP